MATQLSSEVLASFLTLNLETKTKKRKADHFSRNSTLSKESKMMARNWSTLTLLEVNKHPNVDDNLETTEKSMQELKLFMQMVFLK